MRHHVFGKKLNRDIKERKSLFRNLIVSFVTYGRIKTTAAKAKILRRLLEKLVTHAKEGTDLALKRISSILTTKELMDKLIKEVIPKFADKTGGYVRIRKLGKRKGDGTEEVVIEWSVKTDATKKEQEIKKPTENKNKK